MAYRIRTAEVIPEEEEAEVARILRLVMLEGHKEKQAMKCSGGMKRKLSLGMALIGHT